MYTRCERIQYRGPGRGVYTGGHSVHSSENRCVNTRAAVPQLSPSLPLPIVPEHDGGTMGRTLSISVDTLESSGRRRLRRNGGRYPIERCLTDPLPPPPPGYELTSPKDSAAWPIQFALADRYQAASHGSSRARSDLKFLQRCGKFSSRLAAGALARVPTSDG